MPSRRAASLARRASAGIATSREIVKANSTGEQPDLGLYAHDDGRMAAFDERVSGVFKCGKQRQRLFEAVADGIGRLGASSAMVVSTQLRAHATSLARSPWEWPACRACSR